MDDSREELTGVLDYTYMQRLNLGNPVLDDTPESVVSYMFEELDRLVDLDILEYKEPKKERKMNYFIQKEPFEFEQMHQINFLREFSDGEGIKVAILDSGISPTLEIPVTASMNMFDRGGVIEDGAGHGSAIASIVKRIAPKVELFDFKVLDKDGIGNHGTVLDGINLSKEYNVDIAIVSLGAQHMAYSPMFVSAFKNLSNKGVAI